MLTLSWSKTGHFVSTDCQPTILKTATPLICDILWNLHKIYSEQYFVFEDLKKYFETKQEINHLAYKAFASCHLLRKNIPPADHKNKKLFKIVWLGGNHSCTIYSFSSVLCCQLLWLLKEELDLCLENLSSRHCLDYHCFYNYPFHATCSESCLIHATPITELYLPLIFCWAGWYRQFKIPSCVGWM